MASVQSQVRDGPRGCGERAPLAGVESLAVVLPSWIGDTVMATPALAALRGSLRAARIVGIMKPGLEQVLAGNPWLDQMVVCAVSGARGPLRLARAIRAAGGNRCARAVLLLPNSFRAALGARLSAAPIRIGYARDRRSWMLTHAIPAPADATPVSAVQYYSALSGAALGREIDDLRARLFISEAEQAEADSLLQGVTERFIVLNPGANRSDKRWPAASFARVADELASSHHAMAVVTGSPAERGVIERVIAAAKSPVVNLVERGVRLGNLKAVIQRAALVITNDTGTRHIAAALGAPVVTVFGPTDHRWSTLEGARQRLILSEPFLPEELVADRHARACAIDRISVGDVVAASQQLLQPSG